MLRGIFRTGVVQYIHAYLEILLYLLYWKLIFYGYNNFKVRNRGEKFGGM